MSERPPSTALDPCDRRRPITGVDFGPIWRGGSSNAFAASDRNRKLSESHRPELGNRFSFVGAVQRKRTKRATLTCDACHQSSKSTFDPCSPADPDMIFPRMAVRLARWLAIVGIVCFPFSQFSTGRISFSRAVCLRRVLDLPFFIFLSSPDFPTVKHTWVTPYALPAVARAFFLAAAYSWPLAAPGLNFLRFSRALEKKTIRLLKCLVNRLLRRSVRVFSVFTLSSRAEARGAGGPKLHAALARRIFPTLGQCDSLSCSAILQGVMCIFSLWGLKRGMRLV